MADEIPTPDVHTVPVPARDEPADDFQAFVDELRWTKPLQEKVDPARAASVVLCLLERRLTGPHRKEMWSHLPRELRRLLDGCQRTPGAPMQRRGIRTFLVDVQDELGVEPTTAEQILTAVFTALRDRLPEDDVHWVANQLPPELADYWRRPV